VTGAGGVAGAAYSCFLLAVLRVAAGASITRGWLNRSAIEGCISSSSASHHFSVFFASSKCVSSHTAYTVQSHASTRLRTAVQRDSVPPAVTRSARISPAICLKNSSLAAFVKLM
jgi:hypothetical protein